MSKWTLEPGHTAAEFRVRHMMVTWVRGKFTGCRGALDFDPERPEHASVQVEFDAAGLWSGDDGRDKHLRDPDFLDAERHPRITFRSTAVTPVGRHEYRVQGDLTLRGVTRPVELHPVTFHGTGHSPMDDVRAGFSATTRINRHDFGVGWDARMKDGGPVAGDEVWITIDAEAIREDG